MENPWLTVPLTDYEGHMSSGNVGQLEPLSDLFGVALRLCQPVSLAVLGIAGGNGLAHIDSTVTKRVVGVDFNREYLEVARERFGSMPGLKLHCGDLREPGLQIEPVALVHAALVFEHTGLDPALENALTLVEDGGKFSVVLQLPSSEQAGVAPTAFASMQRLKAGFALIDPEDLEARLERLGFDRIARETRALPGGKGLWMGLFARRSEK